MHSPNSVAARGTAKRRRSRFFFFSFFRRRCHRT